MTDQHYLVNSDAGRDEMIRLVNELYNEHGYVDFSWHTGRQRTARQNRSLHKWLGMVATTLNDAGLDMKKVIREDVSIPWTTTAAKEYLWRPIQKALTDQESTTKAERKQYKEVYETLSRHFSEKFGVTLPEWPKKEDKDGITHSEDEAKEARE